MVFSTFAFTEGKKGKEPPGKARARGLSPGSIREGVCLADGLTLGSFLSSSLGEEIRPSRLPVPPSRSALASPPRRVRAPRTIRLNALRRGHRSRSGVASRRTRQNPFGQCWHRPSRLTCTVTGMVTRSLSRLFRLDLHTLSYSKMSAVSGFDEATQVRILFG